PLGMRPRIRLATPRGTTAALAHPTRKASGRVRLPRAPERARAASAQLLPTDRVPPAERRTPGPATRHPYESRAHEPDSHAHGRDRQAQMPTSTRGGALSR